MKEKASRNQKEPGHGRPDLDVFLKRTHGLVAGMVACWLGWGAENTVSSIEKKVSRPLKNLKDLKATYGTQVDLVWLIWKKSSFFRLVLLGSEGPRNLWQKLAFLFLSPLLTERTFDGSLLMKNSSC